jgi:4-hydroxybenzoate polyprenyltransferase
MTRQAHTDIRKTPLIDRLTPEAWRASLQPYIRLMRLDRPIGTWLLVFPCLWSLALSGLPVSDPVRAVWYGLLFLIGGLLMRGAGCIINDMWDRDIDRRVERTAGRPLASGAVSLSGAFALLGGVLGLALIVLVQFNVVAVVMALAAMGLVIVYPLMKRVTWWPQAFLGLTFNWGALVGWAAAEGSLALPPVILYAAGIAWTLTYDTIYAHQDIEDDIKVGVKSAARRLGDFSKPMIGVFAGLALFGLAAAGLSADLGVVYLIGLAVAGGFLAVVIARWRPEDPRSCLTAFKANGWFAALVLVAILVGAAGAGVG